MINKVIVGDIDSDIKYSLKVEPKKNLLFRFFDIKDSINLLLFCVELPLSKVEIKSLKNESFLTEKIDISFNESIDLLKESDYIYPYIETYHSDSYFKVYVRFSISIKGYEYNNIFITINSDIKNLSEVLKEFKGKLFYQKF